MRITLSIYVDGVEYEASRLLGSHHVAGFAAAKMVEQLLAEMTLDGIIPSVSETGSVIAYDVTGTRKTHE